MAKKGKNQAAESGLLLAAVNKVARRNYEIDEKVEAGLVLLGSEVKAIRAGSANLKESYIRISDDEAWLIGCHISPYQQASIDAHAPLRPRKLLLHRREIDKLHAKVREKGLSLIPLRMYFKQGRCKLEFGVGKGKKLHDKRDDVKAREARREMDRALKRG